MLVSCTNLTGSAGGEGLKDKFIVGKLLSLG